ncbi:unnamed protein product [Mytilus coruscus]|uniref:Ig-like domain-containing protein n=1 Tax=Mytilus coruscus TaxID=42192 RepID=A0A6J8D6Z0_MYTCO|nr:unnamed protein product [Mytilus coruscus]
METFFSLLLIDALLSCFTAHVFVTLSGNQHVKRFGIVRLNCSSNNTPIGNTASIQIDGKAYTTITLLRDGCLSSVLPTKCTPDECVCSNQGLWYSHTYKVVQPVGVVNFTCLMAFKAYGSFSDSIIVKIIDFIGPTITTEPGLPFRSDSNVVFTCMVETLSTKITFEWECLGKVEHRSRRVYISNSTKYSSVIMRNIHVIHSGETCRCCINVNGISGNSEISLAISRKPIIDISKAATCESSSAITLYCIINTGFPLFGFNNWMHSRHGTIIRHLEGEKMHTKSLLKFNSCSHDDTGDYTCEAYNEYGGNITFANKTVSLIVYGPPIIKSEETITCNNSSVTLSCTINTGLPMYGFNPWIHYFNGTYIRSLNGSVKEMKSILEVETCSYQNAGEYMCAAWNKYGDTVLLANKTIDFVVYASPVIISSDVIQEQQTTLSATFYSSTEIVLSWKQSNQTLTNSTDQLQTLNRNKIELILYNKSIECDGYIANLSIRSSLIGEYVLFLQNTFGETRLFFEVKKLSTQALAASFDLRTVMFCIIAIGIFILSTAGTVIMSKGIRRKNVIHIIGPHERCHTIPIYHSAPALDTTQNVYAIPETGYLQVTNEQYELEHFQETENKGVENYTSRYMSSNYDEIDDSLLVCFYAIHGGEPVLSLPAVIKYPWYDPVAGQLFPHKTFAMMCCFIAVSFLTDYIFTNDKVDKKFDICNCFQQNKIEQEDEHKSNAVQSQTCDIFDEKQEELDAFLKT